MLMRQKIAGIFADAARFDGQEITVSSDNMPANGREAFSAIRTVLGSCIRDEYLLQ